MTGLARFEFKGKAYWYEPHPRHRLLVETKPLEETPDSEDLPPLLSWPDLVWIFAKRKLKFNFFHLHWPLDADTFERFDVRGRCAVSEEVLKTFDGNFRAALRQLIVTRRPQRVLGFSRYVGGPQSAVLRPLRALAPSPTSSLKASAIINFRDGSKLMESLLSTMASQKLHAPLELIFVNNQSSQAELERIRGMVAALPDNFRSIFLNYDLPFNHSAQCNLAAKRASGDILLMLNNDVRLTSPDCLQNLINAASAPNVASVGPRFIGNRKRLVSAGMEIYCDIRLPGGWGVRESGARFLSRIRRPTAGNTFACTAIPKSVYFELGALDEAVFPIEYNDVDFNLRALRAGKSHIYLGDSEVFHEPGASRKAAHQQLEALLKKISTQHPDIERFSQISPLLEKTTSEIQQSSYFFRGASLVSHIWQKFLPDRWNYAD